MVIIFIKTPLRDFNSVMAAKRIRRETPSINSGISITDLDPELLNLIVERLDQKSLHSLSLVSPRFTPLINPYITKLTLNNKISDSKLVERVFNRFSAVKEISLNFPSIARALFLIFNSCLNIQVLKIEGNPRCPDNRTIMKLQTSTSSSMLLNNVKSLKVRWFSRNTGPQRMIDFIKIFSGIRALELSSGGRWDNHGIQLLAMNVPNLRGLKIVESQYMWNETLDFLAVSCRDLQHVILEGRSSVSPLGICNFISKMPDLQTLCLPSVFCTYFTTEGLIQVGNAVTTLKNLKHLEICEYLVIDDVLKAIGKSELRLLTSLKVHKIENIGMYTMEGLGTLLKATRSTLTSLEVSLPGFDLNNQDHKMSQLVKFLPQLKHIQIITHTWFHETLFSLIENCRVLRGIIIISSCVGTCGSDIHVSTDPPRKKNFSVEYIWIGPRLGESLRTVLESSCPVLKRLESF